MSGFRIEIVADAKSGMHFAQAFTDPGNELVVRSEATYHSQQEAEAQVKAALREIWDKTPGNFDPTIGV